MTAMAGRDLNLLFHVMIYYFNSKFIHLKVNLLKSLIKSKSEIQLNI